jgi:hypothetical protein
MAHAAGATVLKFAAQGEQTRQLREDDKMATKRPLLSRKVV